MTATPFKHQQKSLDFFGPLSTGFDMSEPGTGKTAVHLWNAERRMQASRKKTLVIATKSLLQAAWEHDAKIFTPGLRTSVAWASNREKAFLADADMYITNHDAVNWLVKQRPDFFKKFGHLIIDESTAFKTPNSGRSKAANRIRPAFETCDLLSGTPTPNGILDIWNQAYLMDRGKRLGSSYFHFRNSTCNAEPANPNRPDGPGVRWVAREGADDAVATRLADVSIRHKLDECIDMPEKVIRTVPFMLSPKHAAIYHKMAKDSVVDVNEKTILAVNGAVLWGKLLQIASGSVYGDSSSELIDDARYELIGDLVEERRASIVVFQWQHQRDALIQQMEARGLQYVVIDGDTPAAKRDAIVEAYQAGFYRVMLGHPKSMGHGLTLTRGEATIWASPTINLEWWEQANRRIWRIGQTKRTETLVVIAQGTQDEDAYDRCLGKEIDAATLMKKIKEFYQ